MQSKASLHIKRRRIPSPKRILLLLPATQTVLLIFHPILLLPFVRPYTLGLVHCTSDCDNVRPGDILIVSVELLVPPKELHE